MAVGYEQDAGFECQDADDLVGVFKQTLSGSGHGCEYLCGQGVLSEGGQMGCEYLFAFVADVEVLVGEYVCVLVVIVEAFAEAAEDGEGGVVVGVGVWGFEQVLHEVADVAEAIGAGEHFAGHLQGDLAQGGVVLLEQLVVNWQQLLAQIGAAGRHQVVVEHAQPTHEHLEDAGFHLVENPLLQIVHILAEVIIVQ